MERKIYGLASCLAHYKRFAQGIKRLYLNKENLGEASEIVSFCVKSKIPYHVVTNDELFNITKANHHGGVCLLAEFPRPITLEKFYSDLPLSKSIGLIDATRVKNPHNLGAIIRNAAHFGVNAIVVNDYEESLTGPCFRTAQGGRSNIDVLVESQSERVIALSQNYKVTTIGTCGKKGESLYNFTWPKRWILVLGDEENGLSKNELTSFSRIVSIPGSKKVESLNVSSALAVCLSEFQRQSYL